MRKEPYSPAVKPTNASLSLGRICNTASVMTSPLDSLLYFIFLFVPYVVDAIRLDPKTHFPSTAPYAEYFPPPSPDSDLWQRSSSPKKTTSSHLLPSMFGLLNPPFQPQLWPWSIRDWVYDQLKRH